MICPGCGSANADDALTCVTCGEMLSSDSEKATGRVCAECRYENDTDARFCKKCGTALSNRSRPRVRYDSRHLQEPPRKPKHRTYRRKTWYESPGTLTAIAVAVIGVLVIYGTRQHQSDATAATASSGVVLNPSIKPAFDGVVDRFICGCGRCTEPLWQCNCPTAESERNMIKNDLEGGEKPPRIIDAVYQTYGHLASSSGEQAAAGTVADYVPGGLSLPK